MKNRTTNDRIGNQLWNQRQTSGLPCEAQATEGQLDVPQCDGKLAAGLDENWCFGASCGSRTGFWTADFRAHLMELADVDLDDATNVRPVRASDLDVVDCTRIRISVSYLI